MDISQKYVVNQCYKFTLSGELSTYSVGGTKTIFYYKKAD